MYYVLTCSAWRTINIVTVSSLTFLIKFAIWELSPSISSIREPLKSSFTLPHLLPKVGWRSANNSWKSQIRILADFDSLLDSRTFRKCGTYWICDLQTQAFYADLKVCKSANTYSLQIQHIPWCSNLYKIKNLFKKTIFGTVFRRSCVVFCRNLQIYKICRFAICGLVHLRKLRICNSGMSPRICGLAI